jgi:hypothetical protein
MGERREGRGNGGGWREGGLIMKGKSEGGISERKELASRKGQNQSVVG